MSDNSMSHTHIHIHIQNSNDKPLQARVHPIKANNQVKTESCWCMGILRACIKAKPVVAAASILVGELDGQHVNDSNSGSSIDNGINGQ